MDIIVFRDRLQLVGTLVGGILVFGTLGTLGGLLSGVLGALIGNSQMPNPNTLAVILAIIGSFLTLAIGVALLWVVRLD